MAKLRGRYFMLFVGGSAIGYAKTCEADVQRDIQEVSNPSTGAAKSYRVKRYGWTVTVTGLVDAELTNTDSLLSQLKTGTAVTLVIGKVTWSNSTATAVAGKSYTGSAFVTGIRQSGTLDERATYTANFQGTGELTKITT